jgi:ParB-like chromosome segregation protein Spo0J
MIIADLQPLAVPVDQLVPLSGNPRRGDVEAIARSLAAFGQRKPVVARRDGTVIAGNHTLLAARSLDWPEVAVVRVDDDDTTAGAYALADNRTAELGTYDDRALAALIAEVHDADAEMLAATGWSGDDLQDLLDRLAKADVASPLAFDELDEADIETEHSCPKCGYQWSGNGG